MARRRISQVCSIFECNRPTHGGGYCDSHYHRWKRHGDPLIEKAKQFTSVFDEQLPAYFWQRIAVTANPDKCWLWQYGLTNGYGAVKINGSSLYAHRIAWALSNGREADPTLEILHSCDTPRCCNPHHLSENTHQANMQEAADRNRLPKGSQVWTARLTEQDVIKIRQLLNDGINGRTIAHQYGVGEQAISHIKLRRNWKHL